jgi:hypothetical protein
MKLEFIDVRRAYFHAKARRSVFAELPQDDAEEGMCGELQKSPRVEHGMQHRIGREHIANTWRGSGLRGQKQRLVHSFVRGERRGSVPWG